MKKDVLQETEDIDFLTCSPSKITENIKFVKQEYRQDGKIKYLNEIITLGSKFLKMHEIRKLFNKGQNTIKWFQMFYKLLVTE